MLNKVFYKLFPRKDEDYIRALEKERDYYRKEYFNRLNDLYNIYRINDIDDIKLYIISNTDVVID